MTIFVSVIEVAKFTCQNGVEVMPSPDVTSSPSNETYVDEECKTWCYVRENSIEQSTSVWAYFYPSFIYANRYFYLLNNHCDQQISASDCYHLPRGFLSLRKEECFHRRRSLAILGHEGPSWRISWLSILFYIFIPILSILVVSTLSLF